MVGQTATLLYRLDIALWSASNHNPKSIDENIKE